MKKLDFAINIISAIKFKIQVAYFVVMMFLTFLCIILSLWTIKNNYDEQIKREQRDKIIIEALYGVKKMFSVGNVEDRKKDTYNEIYINKFKKILFGGKNEK